MFYIFLTYMPIFMLIGCNLPFELYFRHYFKLQKIELKQLIDNMITNFLLYLNFVRIENIDK